MVLPGPAVFGRCVVVTLQSEESIYQHGGPAHWRARYQVKVVDQATTKTAAQAALDRIDALLNSQPLTLTGQAHMNTDRVDRFDHIERDGALVWQHVGCDYEVWSTP